MIVRPADEGDILAVCRDLRPLNAREAFALRDHEDPELLAAEILAWEPLAIRHYALCADDGVPIALAGAWMVGPRRAVMALRSTPRWLTIGGSVYRFFRQNFVPFVLAPNVNVAETEVLVDGPSREWLVRLGCVECWPALPRGKRGELFITLAWLNPEVSTWAISSVACSA